MSGDVSQFTCGLVNASYTWYNLSIQSKHTFDKTVEWLAALGEGLIYCSVSMSLVNTIGDFWSYSLILSTFAIIIVTRFGVIFTVFLLHQIPCTCCNKVRQLNLRQTTYFTTTGMVRGAIAFALLLKLPKCSIEE